MTASFDLTTRPWIPCQFLDGTVAELSTRETLARAHEIRAIVDDFPPTIAVLHRHLLAILHRVYDGPKNMREWGTIVRAPTFDAERIDAYLDRVQARMDLLHPTQPFGQVRGLLRPDLEIRPARDMDLRRWGWGNAKPLFAHDGAMPRPVPPSVAARNLLVLHSYAFFGVVPGLNPTAPKRLGEPFSGGAAPLLHTGVALLCGNTLKDTLVANLVRYDPSLGLPSSTTPADSPAWERASLPCRLDRGVELQRLPDGHLDLLTWESRRLELVGDEREITGYVILRGQSFPDGAEPLDPMAFYEKSTTAKPGQRAWRPLAIAAERAFWRDADALFARFDDSARRPLTVIQSCRPEALEVLGAAATYDIALIGLDCGRSKVNVDTARADRLHAVMRRLDDVDARGCVDSALASTISAKEALDHAVKVLCENLLPAAGGRPDPKAVAALCRTISPDARFWSRLGREFNEFSRELRGDLTAAEGRFLRRVLAVTAECFASAIDAAPESGGAARARAVSQQLLDRSLRDLRRDRQVGSTEEVPHA